MRATACPARAEAAEAAEALPHPSRKIEDDMRYASVVALLALTLLTACGGEGATCGKPEDCGRGLTCAPVNGDMTKLECQSPAKMMEKLQQQMQQ